MSIARTLFCLALGWGTASAVTTTGDPADYIVEPGHGLDGVAVLFIDNAFGGTACTGSLLSTGRHILTAAHCLTDGAGLIEVTGLAAWFELPGETAVVEGVAYAVHPWWTGSVANGYDIGVITLASTAPGLATRYEMYRGSDELGQVAQIAGYGVSGRGSTGENEASWPVGTLRAGSNRYDGFISDFGLTPRGTVLGYDFDNGKAINDAFGYEGFTADLGLGKAEVMIGAGDSGGPSFLGGRIAGVHSFSARSGSPPDVDGTINASFGEFGADTRVSLMADWVDSIATPVPEPSTVVGVGGGLLVGFWMRRRKQKRPE